MEAVIILVNYKNDQETIKCAISILSEFNNVDVVIVNNCTINEKLNIDSSPNLLVEYTNENLGYFGGMQFGLEKYILWKGEYPKWIVLSNTDIEITSKDLFSTMNATDDENIGGIAPKIVSVFTKKNQNPFLLERPSKRYLTARRIMFKNPIMFCCFNILRKVKIKLEKTVESQNEMDIYAPHGSFMIINKRYFESGGDIKFNSFLFGEEIFLGENMRRMNLKVRFRSDIEILHKEHVTTSLIKKSKKREYHYNSIVYLLDFLYGKKI